MTLIGVAYVLGTQAAGLLDEWQLARNTEQYRSKAVQQTAAILRKMGTIKVGDTLSNFAFEDIDGELHLLNEILTDKTLITYMKPDCDGCLVELERLRSVALSESLRGEPAQAGPTRQSRPMWTSANHVDSSTTIRGSEIYERVLIISSANPLHLQKLREDYGLGCLMLYDEERLFGNALKIMTFPFNLVVNRDRVILEIHGNVMLEDDYKRLFSAMTDPSSRVIARSAATRQSQPGAPSFVIPAPSVIPATSVIPAKAGTQSSCKKGSANDQRFASIQEQLDPGFRQGDEVVRTEKPDIRQMGTFPGHAEGVIARSVATRQSRQMWTSAAHIILLPDDYQRLFSVTPAHPFSVIPAPFVIPAKAGTQSSCKKGSANDQRFASIQEQLAPGFRQGDRRGGRVKKERGAKRNGATIKIGVTGGRVT